MHDSCASQQLDASAGDTEPQTRTQVQKEKLKKFMLQEYQVCN